MAAAAAAAPVSALESAWQVRRPSFPSSHSGISLSLPLSAHSFWGPKSMQLLIANFSEFQLATVFTFLLHETVFFLSGLPSLLFERFGLFAKYKIQKKSNSSAYQNRCVLRLILYHVCVNLPVMIFSYPAFKFMGLRSSLPLPH
ncbi:Methylsterol monooxygenase 2-1, partial [Dichanthelium oligosanthes]